MWAELLHVERVDIHDNFFDLGGHSLLATQLASRIRKTYQLDLPLNQLFEAPRIEDLAALIAQSLAEQADSDDLEELLDEIEQLGEDDAPDGFPGDLLLGTEGA